MGKAGGGCCSKCVKVSMVILAILCVGQIIAAILKYVFADSIVQSEVLEVILKAALGDAYDDFKSYTGMAGLGAAGITVLGILCTCMTFCSVKCCPEKCKGCIRRCSVSFTFLIYLAIAVIWIVVGVPMWYLPKKINSEFIDDGCKKAAEKKLDDIKVDLTLTEVAAGDLFKMFDEFDVIYAKSINGYMCTDFCICPGKPTDAHYKEYEAVKEDVYNKYGRTWNGGLSSDKSGLDRIDLERFQDASVKKPMFWDMGASEFADIRSANMIGCIDSIPKIVEAYAKNLEKNAIEQIQAQALTNGITLKYEDAKAQVTSATQDQNEEMKKKFDDLGADVDKNKPEEKFINVIKFIEDKYECSGLCSPALFYMTQSVEKGLPKTGCVIPLMEDITALVNDFGATVLASGILFFLMIFFVCPICCYKKTGTVNAIGGSETEMGKYQEAPQEGNSIDESKREEQRRENMKDEYLERAGHEMV